jgi:hypothetical protein
MIGFDRIETDGGTLVIGFVLVLAVLYRHPARGVEAATAAPASLLYFAVLPVLGLVAGVYAALDGPYSTVPVFVLGSYLGVFGLALVFGTLLSPNPVGIITWTGLVLLALAVVALVASLLRVATSLRFGGLRSLAD